MIFTSWSYLICVDISSFFSGAHQSDRTCLYSPSRADTPAEPVSGCLREQQPGWSTRERQCAAQQSAPETPLISPGIINQTKENWNSQFSSALVSRTPQKSVQKLEVFSRYKRCLFKFYLFLSGGILTSVSGVLRITFLAWRWSTSDALTTMSMCKIEA